MKTLTKSLLTLTLVVSSAGLVTMVSASPFQEGPGCARAGHSMPQGKHDARGGPRLERLAKRLDMTEEQAAKARAIRDNYRQQLHGLRDQMRANRVELRELAAHDNFNQAEVRRVATRQGQLKAEMIFLRARQRADMKAILTEEQLVRLEKARMRGNHHGGGKRL